MLSRSSRRIRHVISLLSSRSRLAYNHVWLIKVLAWLRLPRGRREVANKVYLSLSLPMLLVSIAVSRILQFDVTV